MQPIIKDEQGRARFLANRIVRFLLDEASEGRKCAPQTRGPTRRRSGST